MTQAYTPEEIIGSDTAAYCPESPDCLYTLIKKVEAWADKRNIVSGTAPEKQWIKLEEEVNELCEAIKSKDVLGQKDGVGDSFVVLIILCKQLGLDIEGCLAYAYNEIKDRKGMIVDGIYKKYADFTEEEKQEYDARQ